MLLDSLMEPRGADTAVLLLRPEAELPAAEVDAAVSLLCPEAEFPVEGLVSEEWPRLGARLKTCSTPATAGANAPWIKAPIGSRRGRRTSLLPVPKEFRLTNTFQVLDGLSQPWEEPQCSSSLWYASALFGCTYSTFIHFSF
ncbi:hypothetical protein SKAU_G00063720 [Synaphobranchus kaupii]|uniref:Uncharacterized protein n=1 Tax=Synaphobranchus kaupii TaxID=118154 RepID=A0A9Q1G6F2_SYNKA|nr:hypothetical protein SKAU_G00063720 [Synaphobranchus kaupii]